MALTPFLWIVEDKADEEEDEPAPKRGNPRRLSKEARAAQRAFARLGRGARGGFASRR